MELKHVRPINAALFPLTVLSVTMSNALIRSAHSLSLAEKRLVAACIAKTDQISAAKVRMTSSWTVRISARDYAETFDLTPQTAYEQLKAAGDNLFDRYIRTMRPSKRGEEEYKFRWVGAVKYHDAEGWIELSWFPEVVPHLFGLRREFTTYKLKQASALRSIYSWRLFELLQSWRTQGRYTPTIEQFQLAMDVPAGYAKDFKALRIRVIEPAVLELIEKNGMTITWEPQRIGRKTVGIDFKFSYPDNMPADVEEIAHD